MNGYANLLRGREVPAGYRGAALIRDVLGCRHRVAVLQNIPCPLVDLVLDFRLSGSYNRTGFKRDIPFCTSTGFENNHPIIFVYGRCRALL